MDGATQVIEFGSIFTGIGGMIFILIMTFCMYKMYMKVYEVLSLKFKVTMKKSLIEDVTLNKIAKKKGISIEEEYNKWESEFNRNEKFLGSITSKFENDLDEEIKDGLAKK